MALCKHCGEALPKNSKSDFCCSGCAGAYHFISDMGMSEYYTHQRLDENIPALIPEKKPEINWFLPHIIKKDSERYTLYLLIEGVHCAACVWLIEQVLRTQKGVVSAQLNMSTLRLKLVWNPKQGNIDFILEALYTLGYKAHPFDPQLLRSQEKKEEKQMLTALAVAGFSSGNIMIYSVCVWSGVDMSEATRLFFEWISAFIALPTIVFSGRIFFRSALHALKASRVNMDVPISLAILTATGLSLYELLGHTGGHTYFDSAVTLLFFLLIGRYLDRITRHKAHQRTEELLLVEESFVTVEREKGKTEMIPMKQLNIGDKIVLPKGAKLGVDVRIIEGEGWVDTSAITGEAQPENVHKGTLLAAGFINMGERLRCEVMAVGEKSTLHHIMQKIEAATEVKNMYTKWADKAAKLYTPAVHIFAFITFVGWFYFTKDVYQASVYAISVLIITCPCAFALAVPSSMVVAQQALMRKGIFIKDGSALEKLNEVKTIFFDKTGTLTTPNYQLEQMPAEIQKVLYAVAKNSQHPLSQLVVKSLSHLKDIPQIKEVLEVSGKGIKGIIEKKEVRLGSASFCGVSEDNFVETNVYLKYGSKIMPLMITETLDVDTKTVLTSLKKKKYTLYLATGDSKKLSEKIKILPFKQIFTKQTPEEKQNLVEREQKKGGVMMVGDGLNDSPALALADVSISFAKATGLAQATADVILCQKKLISIPFLLNKAKQTKNVVMQNFIFSILYNSIAVPLAMMGYLTPMWAAIFMSSSSLCVLLNALRLAYNKTS